jgi:hypothetical protein
VTPDTLKLLSEILGQVQLSAGAPDFEVQAQRLIVAKRELTEALDAAES